MTARSFYSEPGLNSEIYDERARLMIQGSAVEGDVAFYEAMARSHGGPVLELGSGTGRVAWALADAGHDVTGVEISLPMLQRAESRRASCSAGACGRVRFVPQDMSRLDLGDARFGLVVAPWRSFQALLEPDDQRACLRAARRHLRDDGRLVLDLFQPSVEGLALPSPQRRPSVAHPVTGRVVEIVVLDRVVEPLRQVFHETWELTERADDGSVVRQERERLSMRWTWPQELRWLLELAGFRVVAEHGDFRGGPRRPDGGEIVTVAVPA